MKKFIFITLLAFTFLAPQSWAAAGKAIMVIGKVEKIDLNGNVSRLRRAHQIDAGDIIRTQPTGQAQIRMSDGSIISVRPNSELNIANYSNENNPAEDQATFALIKGGMRAVTGTIGQKNKSRVKFDTPVATLGIRGTDFAASLCGEKCARSGQSKQGLYAGVISGGIKMMTASGSIDIEPGKFALGPTDGSPPIPIDKAPDFMNFPETKTIKGSNRKVYASPAEDIVNIGFKVSPELKDSIVRQARDLGVSLSSIVNSAKQNNIDALDVIKPLLEAGVSPGRVISSLRRSYPERKNQILLAAFSTGDPEINDAVESYAIQSGTDDKVIRDIKSISNLNTLPESLKQVEVDENNVTNSINNSAAPSRAAEIDPEASPLIDPTLIPETSITGDGDSVSPS